MTVPVQRGSGQDDAVYNLLLDGMRDLKDQVVRFEAHISGRLDNLDQRYVPRSEYEARHSDVRNLITKTDARLDAESAARKAAVETEAATRQALEDKLTTGRRFMYTASATGVLIMIGLLSLILTSLR